jgi:hypothetical protein
LSIRDKENVDPRILNDYADYWHSEIGSNPLPADTKNKRIYVSWGEYHDKSMPVEVHEAWKHKGEYNNGIAVMTGRIYKGKNEGKSLVGLDCDNKKGIDEICNSFGFKDINELSNWTRVEQHQDNLNKAHIYIIATKPFKNKGRDPKKVESELLNEIPAIEVKCERQIMFTAPSMHENGAYPYEILGTKEPVLCDECESLINNIFKKYNIQYLQQQQSDENNNKILDQPLRQLIIMLDIPHGFQYRILEGSRHSTMLSFANSLLLKYKYDHNITQDNLKDFFIHVNNKLCSPPLHQNELINSIWRDALQFSKKIMQDFKVVYNDKDNYSNYNKPIVIALQIDEELLKEDIVQSFVKDNLQNNLILEFNHKYPYGKVHVPIVVAKKWLDFRKSFRQLLEEYGINKKHILLILKTLDSNYDLIINKDNGDDDLNGRRDKEEKSKREFVTYKYSQMGKGELHEAVIVNGLPFFLKYNHITNALEMVEKIEENSRILRPPNIEEYPYTPYEFESNEELGFFMEKAREVTLDELFKNYKNIFMKYVDQDKYIITLLSADSIWTYFQDLFSATHYSEGIGDNDVGKSSIGYTFEYTAYRVVKGVAISGANYNRVLSSIEPGQCVIIEDEGDNISEDPDKVKILKSGYEYNGKVPKTNMNTRDQEQKWFKTYGYKMILAEKSLKEYKVKGLVDRTFSFSCRPGKVKYSIKEVVSQNINKSLRFQKLYDELLYFRKLMLCYRLVHYKDFLPEIETGLQNRDQELCKPLLQLFYGTEALHKEIIPTLETFVKQRRTRKGKSLEAALYPIIKKFVFSEAGLDDQSNTYSELKEKKTTVKVPFYRIWDYIKVDGIEGNYDEKKSKYGYETIDYGTLYLNSLPTTISNKFTAEVKKQDYGKALIFDVEKLERFEDLYGSSQLKEDKVKIDVKLKETTDNSGDYDDSDNF